MLQFARFAFYVSLVGIWCVAVPITNELLNGKYEYEFVNIETKGFQSYSADSTYDIKTTAFGKEYNLHLKRLPTIFSKNYKYLSLESDKDNKPVYKEQKIKNVDEPVYRDVAQNSVLHVAYKNGELQLEGSLTPELSIVHSSQVEVKNPTGSHVVVKTNFKKTFMDKMLSFKPATRVPQGYANADPAVPDPVIPELLVIVDYKSAQRLGFDDARVQKYISIFWHAVNTRYELISNPKYQLLVIGIIVNKDKRWQPYIELSRTPVGDMIDLTETLPYLNTFLYHNLNNLAAFDIAMLMTGEDMSAKDETGQHNPNIAGVAYLGGACAWEPEHQALASAGMAEDMAPFFDGVLSHAHEVAHLLGAAHDGDPPPDYLPGHPGAEDCPWADGYLMSYIFGNKNHLRWSDCTIKQIHWLINQPNGVCLREVTNKNGVELNKTLPGQLVSLDSQCQTYLGPNGLYFRGQDMEKICVILYCYKEGDETASSRGPALEGSPCGDTSGKWCRDGECVQRKF